MNVFTTEQRILEVARETLLKYGFHGTTLHQIALKANVNKAAIHYYFRSKEKLYKTVISEIIKLLELTNLTDKYCREENLKVKWFLFTEMYNNRFLFENTIKELYPKDWSEKRLRILDFLDNERRF